MPMYSYLCMKCGTRYEELQNAGDEKAKCPKCYSGSVKKEIGAPSLKFIGNGWPSNDAKTIIGAK